MHAHSTSILAAIVALALTGAARPGRANPNLVVNGGFESGADGWGVFVPDESKDQNCRFDVVEQSPHSGSKCARFQTDGEARFGIGSATSIPVKPGEHYHVSVWIRADSAAEIQIKTPGFAIRFLLHGSGADVPGGHLFISPGNRVSRNTPVAGKAALPTQWTQVGAVFEVPPGTDTMFPSLFAWWVKGTIFVDDFAVELVPDSTPVTPLAGVRAPTATPATAPVGPATGPITSDADLLAALNLDLPGLEKVKAAAQKSSGVDWTDLQSAYLAYRRTASPARWRLTPADRPAQATAQDDSLGDEVIAHRVRDGYGGPKTPIDMGKDFDWTFNPVPRDNPAHSDEWTYCNVSRTEFWNLLSNAYWRTGDEKYASAWVDQLRDFALKNPMHFDPVPGIPSLWRTLDAAERISISWPDAYTHFLMSQAFTPEANWLYLKLNLEHAQLLVHGLENPNRTGNWVATECGALYTIGALFPEFRDAAAWRQTALDRVGGELDRAVPPDGFEAELTPTYHYVAVTGYRQPLEMARLNHLEVPESFRSRIMQMYRAPVLVMDQSGHAVPTNDSEPLDVVSKAREGLQLGDDPLLEWAASHGRQGQAPPDSDALPYAGFYAMRSGWGRDDAFLFFRAGPTGIGHDHESSLEVVLRAWNKTLLLEPGTYPYDSSDWRRFTINTPSHNTIIMDGKWQHRGEDKPPVTQPTGDPWVTTPLFDYAAGKYDAGYQENDYRARPFYPQVWKGELDKSVSHTRRVLFLRPAYALILDTLDGTGTHTFDAHFNLDAPEARLDPTTLAAFTQNPSGAQLALYPLDTTNLKADIVEGQKSPLLGWVPVEHRAIPTVRYRKQQAAPAVFATFLYPYRQDPPEFQASPLEAQGADFWTQSLKIAQEKVDIALTKSGATVALTLPASLVGAVHAETAGLVIRQMAGASTASVGAWGLTAYNDPDVELSAAAPVSLILLNQRDQLLLFNAGDAASNLSLKRPFVRGVTLAPKVWTAVSSHGEAPAAAPTLFKPMDTSSAEVAYSDYIKRAPALAAAPNAASLKIDAAGMSLPDGALKLSKTGATGAILSHWDKVGSVLSAHADIAQAGWYRMKIRYCSGGEPLRSVLVNGKLPFAEAQSCSFAPTIGDPPSDGWSNLSDDWKEVAVGDDQVPGGWRIYLASGPCELALRNEGGGLNLDWIELQPAS